MLDPYEIILISVISFFATYFAQLAGGGGLLVTPVLIFFGLPVPVALGTRRFSTIGGITAGLVQFHRWKQIDYRLSWFLVTFTIAGCAMGYLVVDSIEGLILKRIIGLLIIITTIALIFEKTDKVRKIKGRLYRYRNIIGPFMAILSGALAVIIGGGGGTAFTYLLIIVYGQTILQSIGTRRLPLLAGHLLAAILFVWAGNVYYPLAFSLLFTNTLGGWFGSRFYLKKGEQKVRAFFFAIIILLGLKTMLF
jgi:uncharacterized membrane protein YfcA